MVQRIIYKWDGVFWSLDQQIAANKTFDLLQLKNFLICNGDDLGG
jgi:hypothetical protein